MISFCCCGINARYDVQFFTEFLEQHNDPSEFEICFTHDDRVNDGSAEFYAKLEERFSNFHVIRNSKEDTVAYLRKVLNFYEQEKLFDSEFMAGLHANLEAFEQDKLFEPRRAFLWLTSGLLYNKACSIAKGDVLVITPGDFVHLYRAKDLETYVNNYSRNGYFYSKPNAIWARVSNQNPEWLKKHVEEVHNGLQLREDFRWDSNQLYRDYLACPCKLEDYWLADFKNNRLINMAERTKFEDFYSFNRYAHSPNSGIQAGPGFHGFHAMTRKSYNEIGGFTEIFYGRAFPDDRMSDFGRRHFGWHPLPSEFSVGWIGMHEILNGVGEPLPQNWQEVMREKDPLCDEHPIAGVNYGHVHLHQGLALQGSSGKIDHPNHVHTEMVSRLRKFDKPIRLGT